MLAFEARAKPEYPDKNLLVHTLTYDAESGNRTRVTLVGGEYSHHCKLRLGREGKLTGGNGKRQASRLQFLIKNIMYKISDLARYFSSCKLECLPQATIDHGKPERVVSHWHAYLNPF